MTVAFDLRPYPPELAREDVRRGLTALLRRRVPGQEVDDLAQTILCDALASGTIPSDPDEMRRWLVGIARHKIADYHRRNARVNGRCDGDAPLATCAAPPPAYEEREMLDQLLGAIDSRRDAETMEWLVREHGGERLVDIAAAEKLPAPVVRQRVSRLRRALKSRWMAAPVLAMLVAVGAFAFRGRKTETVIRPEIVAPVPSTPASAVPQPIPDVEGDWIIQSVQPDRVLTPTEQKYVDTYAKVARVHVENGVITASAGTYKETWTLTSADTVKSVHGETEHVDLNLLRDRTGPRVELRLPNHPRLGGKIVLKRPIY